MRRFITALLLSACSEIPATPLDPASIPYAASGESTTVLVRSKIDLTNWKRVSGPVACVPAYGYIQKFGSIGGQVGEMVIVVKSGLTRVLDCGPMTVYTYNDGVILTDVIDPTFQIGPAKTTTYDMGTD